MRSTSVAWASIVALGSLMACPSLDPFACLGDEHCTLAPEGVCHDQGVCSYPDEVCDSGRRYSPNSGAVADQCVDKTPTTQTGSTDASGTSSSSGDPDSSGPGPLPVCGDGIVEGDEQCDDGMDELDPTQCNDCTADCQRVQVTMEAPALHVEGRTATFLSVIVDAQGDLVAAGRTAIPHDTTQDPPEDPNSGSHDWLIARFAPDGTLQESFSPALEGRDQINALTLHPMTNELFAIGMRDTAPRNGNNGGSDNELVVMQYVGNDLVPVYLHRNSDPDPSMGQHGIFTEDGRLVVVGAIEGQGSGFERWDRLILDDVLGTPQPLEIPLVRNEPNPMFRDIAYIVAEIPDNGGLVVGGTMTPAGQLPDQEHSQRWLARYDVSGTSVAEYVSGGDGDGNDEIFGLVIRGEFAFAIGTDVYNRDNNEQEWGGRLLLENLSSDGWGIDLPVERPANVSGLIEDGDDFVITVDLPDATAVANIDENGQCQWLVYSPAGARRLSSLVRDSDGTIVVVGSTSLEDTTVEESRHGGDALLARLRVGG